MTQEAASPIQSNVECLAWPALPGRGSQTLFSLLLQLEHSQWLSPEEIERRQFAQLRRLLLHSQATVPFYRERLRPVAEKIADSPLTPAIFASVPILTRGEIQEAGQALWSDSIPAGHGKITVGHTSGSTGKPLEIRQTTLSAVLWRAFTLRDHFWKRRDFSGALAVIRGRSRGASFPEGQSATNWGVPRYAGIETGPMIMLDINCSPEQQIDWLQRKSPTYLSTYPTNVVQLARHCLKHGIELPSLREVLTLSEIVPEEARRLAREAWGVSISDLYSSRDIGYMAVQCPEEERLHVQSEACRLEVLDSKDRPCKVGQVGRVVATRLHEFAMPLIRYELGDHAEVGAACSCGRGLPMLNRVVGRSQQMLALPDGGQRWVLFSDTKTHDLRGFGVAQFQFVQTSVSTLEARFSLDRPVSDEDEAGMRAWISDVFGSDLEVALSYVDEIPRTPDGKYFEFMSEVRR